MSSTKIGQLFTLAYTKPTGGTSTPTTYPGGQMYFYQPGYGAQQTVYADVQLQVPFAQPVIADASGRFQPVFLNPALNYSWILYTALGAVVAQAPSINVQNTNTSVQLYKPAATEIASIATLFQDADLVYAIPAAGTYRVEMDLYPLTGASGTTPGIALRVNFSGTINNSAGNCLSVVGLANGLALTASESILQLSAGIVGYPLNVASILNQLRIAGTVQVTSAGTLALYWSQYISSSSFTGLNQGSSMTVTRIG